MTPDDRAVIESWGRKLDGSIRIGMGLTQDRRSVMVREFCEELKIFAPLVVIGQPDITGDGLPFIEIDKRIKFRGVPNGPELKPFLDALSGINTDDCQKEIPDASILAKIKIPALLKVYISPHCPFCPKVVSSVLALARKSPLIYAEIIDAELFSELSEKDQVRSAPTVMLDDRFRWIGSVDISELIDMIISSDPSHLSESMLRKMIEEGKAKDLAKMMAQSNVVYSGFIKLLAHPQWPVRLGAMAAFEYLEEVSPVLAEEARLKLWDFFDPADNPVKGDIAYLLGGSKDPDILTKLRSVINGPYAKEVCEAAQESLEHSDLSCLS